MQDGRYALVIVIRLLRNTAVAYRMARQQMLASLEALECDLTTSDRASNTLGDRG